MSLLTFLKGSFIKAGIHCKLKGSVSAPICQISPEAPGADTAHFGAFLVAAEAE